MKLLTAHFSIQNLEVLVEFSSNPNNSLNDVRRVGIKSSSSSIEKCSLSFPSVWLSSAEGMFDFDKFR